MTHIENHLMQPNKFFEGDLSCSAYVDSEYICRLCQETPVDSFDAPCGDCAEALKKIR